ncbi:MAG: substrate-binding domain-containing protein [Rhodospirillaceae bacterium]
MIARLLLPVLILLPVLSGPARAERIELGDGSVLMGTLGETGGDTVTVRLDLGPVITLKRSDLVRRDTGAVPGVLRLHGSNPMGERLVPALIERFLAGHGAGAAPWLAGSQPLEKTLIVAGGDADLPHEIEVRAFGSSTAFAALQTGAADIGLSSRRIRESESAALRRSGSVSEQLTALDGIAAVVHPGNPVRALTLAQLAAIFSGEITDWGAVGGTPGPIALRLPDERSALPEIFQAQAMSGRRISPTAERFESSQEIAARVAAEPGTIALVSLAFIDQARALDIRSCSGIVAPTPFSIKAGDYPLSRALYLYGKPQPRPPVIDQFMNFAAGSAGQSAIAAAGFVNLEIENDNGATRRSRRQVLIDDSTIDLSLARAFLKITEGAGRLSLTFRFDEGSITPTGTADDEIRRLISYMKSPAGQGRQLLVLGFSGPTGIIQTGAALSDKRAKEIAARLSRSGLKVAATAGFGPLTARCPDAPDARDRSRSVEVWAR